MGLACPKLTINKSPQFLAYVNETLSLVSALELVILTKFHDNKAKIVDALFMVNLEPTCKFLAISFYNRS